MKALLKWFAKVIGSAVSVILVVVLFPYASRLAARLLPDESGASIRISATLAAELADSARLETLRVTEDRVLNNDIIASFIGSVASVNASYTYEASFGIDLKKVRLSVEQNTITFELPPAELLHDSLTPKEVYQDNFWYPGFTFADYEKVLEAERMDRRNSYLSGDASETLWNSTLAAFQAAIEPWIREANGTVEFVYTQMKNAPETST